MKGLSGSDAKHSGKMPIEEHYTIEEVAAKLKFEPRTIQGWLKSKPPKLKGIKIGGEWRITEEAVKDFIKNQGGE